MSKKESDPALERLRVMIGATLIVVCGAILWKTRIQPFMDHGKTNIWESRAEIREKFNQWLQEKRVEDLSQQFKEAEREAVVAAPAESKEGKTSEKAAQKATASEADGKSAGAPRE